MQEAAVAAVSGEDVTEPQTDGSMPAGSQGFASTGNFAGAQANGGEGSEVARFEASKEKKHSLESGITVFNRYSHFPQIGATSFVLRILW